MKKYLFIAVALLAFAFNIGYASASITFDPVSPQPAETVVAFTCSIGDASISFDPDGVQLAGLGCPDTLPNYDLVGYYNQIVVECLLSSSLTACDSQDLTDARNDPGYISESNYTFYSPNPCISGTNIASNTLGCAIDNINGNIFDYFQTLLAKYWPYILGFLILITIWFTGKAIISRFR